MDAKSLQNASKNQTKIQMNFMCTSDPDKLTAKVCEPAHVQVWLSTLLVLIETAYLLAQRHIVGIAPATSACASSCSNRDRVTRGARSRMGSFPSLRAQVKSQTDEFCIENKSKNGPHLGVQGGSNEPTFHCQNSVWDPLGTPRGARGPPEGPLHDSCPNLEPIS